MKYLLIILIAQILTSCSTVVDFHGSTNTFTPPEVIGKTLGLSGQLGYSSSNKFILSTLEQASIFSSQINVNNHEGLVKDNNFQSQIGIGFRDRFEFYYRAMGDSPDPFGVKWQILGDAYEKKSPGIKVILFGGLAPNYNDHGSLVASNGSGTTRTYSTDLKVSMSEIGSSCGYRVNENSVFYFTPYFRQYKANALLTSSTNPNYTINKNPIIRGFNIGGSFNNNSASKLEFVVMVEAGYSHSQYSSSIETDDYSLGGSIGLNMLSF